MLCHLELQNSQQRTDFNQFYFGHFVTSRLLQSTFSSSVLKKMSKIAQNDKHKISFLHQQRDSHKVISQKLGISHHGVLCVLKNVRIPDKWRISYQQQMNSIWKPCPEEIGGGKIQQGKGNWEKRVRHCKLQINWTENMWHEVWQSDVSRFLVQIVIDMYRGGQESSPTVSAYTHLQNTIETWFETAFQPMVLRFEKVFVTLLISIDWFWEISFLSVHSKIVIILKSI